MEFKNILFLFYYEGGKTIFLLWMDSYDSYEE